MTKKYLGVDYGTVRIGLAIADAESKTAVVYGTVDSVAAVADVVKKEDISAVVVGEPFSVSDRDHELPDDFLRFKQHLKTTLTDVELIFEDERLSSKYADSLIGGKKTKAGRDEIAAIAILQGYLDSLSLKN